MVIDLEQEVNDLWESCQNKTPEELYWSLCKINHEYGQLMAKFADPQTSYDEKLETIKKANKKFVEHEFHARTCKDKLISLINTSKE